MFIKKFTKYIVVNLLRVLPKTDWGDRIHMLVYFFYAHKRLPKVGSNLFNDYLFFHKTGPALRDPLVQMTSDKYLVKIFVEGIALRSVTPKTFSIFNSIDEIDRDTLPNKCILKPTHHSGGEIFLNGPDDKIKKPQMEKLKQKLKENIYFETREKNYHFIRPRIICEELISDVSDIKDYKVFCQNGNARFVQVDVDRYHNHMQNFYTPRDWTPIQMQLNQIPSGPLEARPIPLDDMIDLAEKIATFFDFVRVDFYVVDKKFFVGELTHCHVQAHGTFDCLEAERFAGKMLLGING